MGKRTSGEKSAGRRPAGERPVDKKPSTASFVYFDIDVIVKFNFKLVYVKKCKVKKCLPSLLDAFIKVCFFFQILTNIYTSWQPIYLTT